MSRNGTSTKVASNRIRVNTAKPAPVASTSLVTTYGKANTLPEMPTANASPAMSTPKPARSAKKNSLR